LQIEKLVADEVANILNDRSGIAAALEKNGIPTDQSPSALAVAERLRAGLLCEVERAAALLSLIDRVELGQGILRVTISLGALLGDGHTGIMLAHELPLAIKRRGVEMRLVSDSHDASSAKVDPILLKEVARAYRCFDALLTGRASSITAVAAREGMHDRYVSSLLPLAFLAPEIVASIVRGTQPKDLTAKKLIRRTHLPLDWQAQKQALGFT
jgi:hypothetical protein